MPRKPLSDKVKIGANILIMPVLHAKAAGNGTELLKTEPFIEMPRMDVGGHDRVELQNTKTVQPCLNEAVFNQFFADMQSPAPAADRIARIADVSAAADVIGMEDVKAEYFAAFGILGDGGIALCGKKFAAVLRRQAFLLRKSDSLFNDLVPDPGHSRKIIGPIRPNRNLHACDTSFPVF